MAMKRSEQFCLRFSMDNPRHVKVYQILENLNLKIYKSKTQFIINAIEAYIEEKDEDTFSFFDEKIGEIWYNINGRGNVRMKKSVVKEIDKAIKDVWLHEICEDYKDDGVLMEASLQCALYHHLRNRLKYVLEENDLRIYSEYTFKENGYRADLVIVHITEQENAKHLRDCIDEYVAIIELKHVSGGSRRTINWVKEDIFKLKDYARRNNCQLYFGVIYENDCNCLNWMDKRSTNNWANGVATELNAGWIDEEFCFEVNSYNHMNYQHKSVICDLYS